MSSITAGEAKIRVLAKVGRIGVSLTDQEVLAAINDAIEDGATGMPYDVAPDETVTLAADTYEYSLASVSMNLIHCITMADSDGDFNVDGIIGRHRWYIVQGTTPKLKFVEDLWSPVVSRKLRIEGQKYQAVVDDDADVIYMFAPFVVAKAAATLLGNLGSPRETIMLQQAEDARQRSPQRPKPNARIV
jgi:hypothetical protein